MTVAEYLPDHGGRWLAAVRDEALLVLPADRAADLLALWPHLDGGAAPHVIDRLAGSGITAAPSFALVVREPATRAARALVRGELTVTLGETEVSGAGVSTWQERATDGEADVRVAIRAASDLGGVRLPVVEGVVAASVVDWPVGAARAQAGPAGASAPASVADRETAFGGDDVEDAEPETTPPTPTPTPLPTPDERTMVPEDTIVGVSRTERPRIERPVVERSVSIVPPAAGVPAPDSAAAPGSRAPVIVPPDFGSTPPALAEPAAAPPLPTSGPAPAQPAPATLGDHDGLTVARADLRRLRDAGPAAPSRPDADAAREPAASAPPAPSLALRLPDGSIEPIVGELVLGRAPSIGRVSGTRIPRPVVIGAGDPDISRTHLRVAVEGGTAVVTDLDSRNGTQVVAPGQPPMRLRPSEATPVLPDTVIDLGGGWSIQVVVR
ncbi:FHA domain-containing protein [Agromyces sp. GXS1127]|uniref:FHA domain-containing protein n=1 Tax=Agromyces sp. GXS1127 TaxID=3424181 RepID=UPI003D311D3B